MNPILSVRDLTKAFGAQRALAGVSLDLSPGEILGLLGPNGAGKTTLVRAVVGRVVPDSGVIELLGQRLRPGDTASRSPLGWVPQEIALYDDLTAKENLEVAGRYLGLSGELLNDAVVAALRWSGLSDRARDRVKVLSGGMKRRLNMAAGVLHQPKVILMDEPTVGIDPQSREKIYDMIGELRSRGIALIYTTHYMEEAERLCDRIAVIDHGKIIAEGTKEELVQATIGPERQAIIHCDSEPPSSLVAQLKRRGATVDGRTVRLPIKEPRREVRELLDLFEAEHVPLGDFSMQSASLQAVFLHLTGRELRE